MMKQKVVLIMFLALVMVTGCNDSRTGKIEKLKDDPRTGEIEKLKEECIRVHDEVMPKMGEIASLRMSLKDWRKTLDADTSDSLLTLKRSVLHQVQMLDSADEAMMDWMANYEPRYEGVHSLDSAIVYYSGQKSRITDVKKLMEESINDANKLLEERD